MSAIKETGGTQMLLLTTYKVKAHLSKADFKKLMDEFGKRGAAPGEIAHYVHTDGSGGSIVSEVSEIGPSYESLLAYTKYMEFDVTPVLAINDAVGPLLAYVGNA
jgi:hypothetical protein